ncbi:isoniazid inducible gene protein IniA [Saccharopolyspora subtropica]|uniref:Isoniazid inducible gene protein IniA n=1 Tax=Saccharopolyspora thermophila TaxID=89367 RepID=A0A917K6Q9_9PSEU|nr:dynamin family protein [Saccharopolyspora subtropica]GGJ01006.1 isoniazid inducible gene protein IniA [Saccharopolyspora subtropica]
MIETALVELIDRATAECAEQQRADLHNRLRQIRTRVLDPTQLVLVVGESKQGKSALVNAIVNAPVCASGDDVTTLVPTLVRHSDEPTAQLVEHAPTHGPAALERRPVPIEQVREHLERALALGRPITRGEVGIPRQVLQNGLALMDTPGVGSMSSSLTATTLAVVAEADALLMVSDATQELTTTELAFLKQATALCPNVALVLPKIDRTPHWRRVVEVNRKHLNNAGIAAKIFPVSAAIRMRAMQTQNTTLNAESGFPPLLEFLKTELAGKHEQLTRRLVAHNVSEALSQVNDALKAELAAQNPRTAAETLVELETAQRRAEDLRRVSSRWQKTLNDGISALYTDIEFDFRERAWAVLHQVSEIFETADPLEIWDEFRNWLTARLTDAMVETFQWLEQRQAVLAEQVADEMLAEHAGAIPNLERIRPPDPFDGVPEPKLPPGSEYKKFDQFLTGLRGSYGGVLMFGLITGLANLPLINVVSISAGVLLGTKSLREDKDMRLRRRQTEAKAAVQRHVEQVIFHVNKHAKDAIRGVHRALHNHFMRITEDAQMEISLAIQEIKRSAERSAVDRDQRAREIRKKLEELTVLRRRVTMLTQNRITAA